MESMSQPTVSIIIYYDVDRGWLNEAIRSVRQQKYDGKIELILSTGNGSASANLNEGIKKAKGEYLRYLSEDDLLPQYSIHCSVLQFKENNADFIHGKAINFFGYPVIYDDGHISFSGRVDKQEPKLRYPTLEDLTERNVIHGGTVMYKTSLLQSFNKPFDEDLTCAEEYDLNMKLLKNGATLDYCNEVLYFYRRHDKQKSLGKGIDQIERAKKIQEIIGRYK